MSPPTPHDHVGQLFIINTQKPSHGFEISLLQWGDDAVRQRCNNESLKVCLMEQPNSITVEAQRACERHEGLAFPLVDVAILKNSLKQARIVECGFFTDGHDAEWSGMGQKATKVPWSL